MKNYAIAFIVFLIAVLLFHLSPFSQIDRDMQCHSFIDIPNPAGVQTPIVCGALLSGDPTFPFKISDEARFCIQNKDNVEASCKMKVEKTILEAELEHFYKCFYFFGNGSKSIIISVSSDESGQSKKNIRSLMFDYEDECPGLTIRD